MKVKIIRYIMMLLYYLKFIVLFPGECKCRLDK